MFKLWSGVSPIAKETLKPDLGIRSWSDITEQDKVVIWRNFVNKGWFSDDEKTFGAIYSLNENNKARAYCKDLLKHGGPHYYDRGEFLESCCKEIGPLDFYRIFHQEHQDAVYELFSYYVVAISKEYNGKEKVSRFQNCFNDISGQFGLNIVMAEDSFIPRQDEKIIKEVYEPVLGFLFDPKWKEVNNLFSDAFDEYRKNTPQGYSNCVTNTVSALQAFLQITVHGNTGKGDIPKLIQGAQEKELIPSDSFTKGIFKNLESIIARERQEVSVAHPKKQYASENNARLMMNLSMIFIQHCVQGIQK